MTPDAAADTWSDSGAPLTLGSADSALGFLRRGVGDWEEWDRFLTLDGKPAYHLGNICNTCEFLFERLEGANRSLAAEQLRSITLDDPSTLDRSAIEQVGALLPVGEYLPFYTRVSPRLVTPGREGDYFAEEQIATWGQSGFWGLPHHTKTEYYRGRTIAPPGGESGDRAIYEFIVPMFPHGWLDEPTVSSYKARHGAHPPTAVAISILDVKAPALFGNREPEFPEHWCLSHYLLDGHHKVFAAAETGAPVGVLSFLAVGQGVSSVAQASEAVGRVVVARRTR